jgi:hypothetical protein
MNGDCAALKRRKFAVWVQLSEPENIKVLCWEWGEEVEEPRVATLSGFTIKLLKM